MDKKRNYYIDVLKTLGTCCLFLAHVSAPQWLENIRAFDVPLLVLLSGLLYSQSFKKSGSYISYMKKRIYRLVYPTWSFLILFYILMNIAGRLPSWDTILKSFLLQRDGGIAGYTWIIWVYLICALISPFLNYIVNNRCYYVIIIGTLIVYELMEVYTSMSDIRVLYYTIFTAIPYGILLSVGIRWGKITNRKEKLSVLSSIMIMHIMYTIFLIFSKGKYISVGEYKYPARFYYMSYGIVISLILIEVVKKYERNLMKFQIVSFVSMHSLWIYLWHVLALAMVNYVLKVDKWYYSYIFVLTFALIITWIQNKIISRVIKCNEKFKILNFLTY